MYVKIIGIKYQNIEEKALLTPELLASVLARYSRSNKGIEELLSSVDISNPDKSIDNIFKFIDYGHASIAGLTSGIPIAIDGCSMFLAYKIFEYAQYCDGQESSTRYIKMDSKSIPNPNEIGIPDNIKEDWLNLINFLLNTYNTVYQELEKDLIKDPTIIKIPANIPEKTKTRLFKNYALDRARYFIPFCLKTNAVFVMTGRAWTGVLKQLESLPYPEAIECTTKIRKELSKIIPRLIKHSYPDTASLTQIKNSLNYSIEKTKKSIDNKILFKEAPDKIHITINNNFPSFLPAIQTIKQSFSGKTNRYSILGSTIRRIFIRASWNNIAIAELRDLNRHRTGYRFSTLIPTGFYLPTETNSKISTFKEEILTKIENTLTKILSSSSPYLYPYFLPLGIQVPFEHATQLDKFIYEIELRTDIGAHFRYSEHLKLAYKEIIKKLPNLKDYIKIGHFEEYM